MSYYNPVLHRERLIPVRGGAPRRVALCAAIEGLRLTDYGPLVTCRRCLALLMPSPLIPDWVGDLLDDSRGDYERALERDE